MFMRAPPSSRWPVRGSGAGWRGRPSTATSPCPAGRRGRRRSRPRTGARSSGAPPRPAAAAASWPSAPQTASVSTIRSSGEMSAARSGGSAYGRSVDERRRRQPITSLTTIRRTYASGWSARLTRRHFAYAEARADCTASSASWWSRVIAYAVRNIRSDTAATKVSNSASRSALIPAPSCGQPALCTLDASRTRLGSSSRPSGCVPLLVRSAHPLEQPPQLVLRHVVERQRPARRSAPPASRRTSSRPSASGRRARTSTARSSAGCRRGRRRAAARRAPA